MALHFHDILPGEGMRAFHHDNERFIDKIGLTHVLRGGSRRVRIACTEVGERQLMRTKSVKGFTRPETHNLRGHFESAMAANAEYADPSFAGRCGDGTDGIV